MDSFNKQFAKHTIPLQVYVESQRIKLSLPTIMIEPTIIKSTQGSKNVRFSPRDQITQSTNTPTQKAKPTKPILKSNPRMTTDDQQSVSIISKDTDSQADQKLATYIITNLIKKQ